MRLRCLNCALLWHLGFWDPPGESEHPKPAQKSAAGLVTAMYSDRQYVAPDYGPLAVQVALLNICRPLNARERRPASRWTPTPASSPRWWGPQFSCSFCSERELPSVFSVLPKLLLAFNSLWLYVADSETRESLFAMGPQYRMSASRVPGFTKVHVRLAAKVQSTIFPVHSVSRTNSKEYEAARAREGSFQAYPRLEKVLKHHILVSYRSFCKSC